MDDISMWRNRTIAKVTSGLLLTLLCSATHAQMDCGPLDPRASVSKEELIKIEGTARSLFRSAGVGYAMESRTREEIQNLLRDAPPGELDQIKLRTLYIFCGMVANAKGLMVEKKVELFAVMMNLKYQNIAVAGRAQQNPAPTRQPAKNQSTVKRGLSDAMVFVPGGEYQMGDLRRTGGAWEGPVRSVQVRPFFISKYEVTRRQFREFAAATRYRTQAERNVLFDGCGSVNLKSGEEETTGRSWRDPGFVQSDDEPVLCVSWYDAQEFISWLNQSGSPASPASTAYRLPTEEEWELAARAGSDADFPWGMESERSCDYANVGDRTPSPFGDRWAAIRGDEFDPEVDCDDEHFLSAKVGSFKPNQLGLYDMVGNAAELTDSCWNWVFDREAHQLSNVVDCSKRASRGGSFATGAQDIRLPAREAASRFERSSIGGFRVARSAN